MASTHWETFLRCLRLVARLQQGDCSREELLMAGGYTYEPNKNFDKDRERLKNILEIDLRFDYSEKVYRLYSLGQLPLMELPKPALEGLDFILHTFPPASPHFRHIKALVEALQVRLPPDYFPQTSVDGVLNVNLNPSDDDYIADHVFLTLQRANRERRMVEFSYHSPKRDTTDIVIHVVQPRRLAFNTQRGHYYLKGYCEETRSPRGELLQRRYFNYRLGRIVSDSILVLPTRFPIHSPPEPAFEVVYRLSPRIARFGVSQRFDEMELEHHLDGSVMVTAKTDDIFTAARTLLHYGGNCQVLGGSELLAEIQKLASELAAIYLQDAP